MAEAAVLIERVGTSAVLVLSAGEGHVLDRAARAALADALARAAADPGVAAIVLTGEGEGFGGRAAEEDEAPSIADLARAIEGAGKPVIAALHGAVTDGALDLALAADLRLAEAGARLGFPAIARGMLPRGGATQRLPRLAGGPVALDLLGSGRLLTAGEALAAGLVDQVLAGPDALLAAALGPVAIPPRRGLGDLGGAMAAVTAARQAAAEAPLTAARRIVDCVEAALVLPFAQGLDFEAAARADVLALPEVAALRWIARAEARLTGPRPLAEVAVAASGGVALAVALLAAGRAVTLVATDRTALIAALELVAATQSLAVEAARMTEAAREAGWARLTPALAWPEGMAAVEDGLDGVTVRHGAATGRAVLHDGLAEVEGDLAAAVLAGVRPCVLPVRGPVLVPLRDALAAVARHEAARAGRAAVAAVLAGVGQTVAGLPEGGAEPPGPLAARIMGALANAGLRLIGAGVADRPGDIDAALVHGAGWPRHLPGPMLWAATRGLLVVRADLRRWQDEAPDLWSPAPLIDVMLRRGTRLEELEG